MHEIPVVDPAVAGDDRAALPAMLGAALPPACFATLGALVRCRIDRRLDVAALADRLGRDRDAALDAVNEAESAFQHVFGVHVLPPHRAWFEPDPSDDGAEVFKQVGLGARFLDLLDHAHAPVRPAGPAPVVDAATTAWVAALAAAVADGGGLHLALRCQGDGDRDARDLAAMLGEAGVAATVLDAADQVLAAGLLKAELHVDDAPVVVLSAKGGLLDDGAGEDADRPDAGDRGRASASSFVHGAMPWLGSMRLVCVWCVGEDAVLPASLDGLIGGCIGPIRPEASWSRAIIADAVGADVGPSGIAAIAGSLRDPRDAAARGRAARMLWRGGVGIDEACAAVAGSFVPAEAAPVDASPFDLGLYEDDPEIALLFARAREVALAGGRLLFHGPPGGGKTTLCRALSAEMARAGAAGPPVTVTAARICVRPYGGTERVLAELWRRAAVARSPLLIDELDAMCGVRDPSSPSGGNAYLVRMLTDEWIRNFDAHPEVPVLATVNDLAVDPAVLRRFTAIHHVGADLAPAFERRAWTSLLGMDPPSGWRPCGAGPSDFDVARRRCRMLGLEDAAALAAAVERARDARRGARRGERRSAASGPLH